MSARSLANVDADSAQAGVELRLLLAALFAAYALDNLLLLGFLGFAPLLTGGLAILASATMGYCVWKTTSSRLRVTWPAIGCACLAAFVLLVLGGEGRWFYANPDWKIRDAVLADLGNRHWPFDYIFGGRVYIMRAPLGMYFVPALLGGASQSLRDYALLFHNTLYLTLILSIGSVLFKTRLQNISALIIVVFFSGLDIIGTLLVYSFNLKTNFDQLEYWAPGSQYSSHITQLFWVPQHAFAGWTCALAYILWMKKIAPVGVFGAAILLTAIWSPFAVLGSAPFALFACARALWTRQWGVGDVVSCCLAAAISACSLAYLNAHGEGLEQTLTSLDPIIYIAMLLIDVFPITIPLLFLKGNSEYRTTTIIILLCLMLMPFYRVGDSIDFQMRASIVAIAIASVFFAEYVVNSTRLELIFIGIALIGSVTGIFEIKRVFNPQASPAPLCSLQGVWKQLAGPGALSETYVTPIETMPPRLRPHAFVDRAGLDDPAQCWSRPWRNPF